MTLYSPHPSLGMVQDWLATLKTKTGRDLKGWLAHIKKDGPKDEKSRRDWLKKKYDLGTNTCWWLAERSVGKGAEEDSPEAYLKSAEGYVETMFAGKRAALRPIYDALLRLALDTADDVKACPGKTIVALYRNHVFAQIRPATNTRIDLGLALGALLKAGEPIPAGLIDTGGFAKKDRITHRIEITELKQVGATCTRLLRKAYDLDSAP